jgi:hypothetical protein
MENCLLRQEQAMPLMKSIQAAWITRGRIMFHRRQDLKSKPIVVRAAMEQGVYWPPLWQAAEPVVGVFIHPAGPLLISPRAAAKPLPVVTAVRSLLRHIYRNSSTTAKFEEHAPSHDNYPGRCQLT